ncbi:E3 ubiquitin-protein ligase arih1 [Elysia marginata]|uniref:RBR-type E3 ubiquitin transferase n=1 Tax=Elysia marginata TaxID=1093978 RepID=A0AAV4G204_9GAST|nr:E3 ubiquitin-protein ligase arih1 [Elysia marginata]
MDLTNPSYPTEVSLGELVRYNIEELSELDITDEEIFSDGYQTNEETSPQAECEICLGVAFSFTPSRCCESYFCDECMSTYINSKVSEGQYKIECPGTDCHSLLRNETIEVYLGPKMLSKYTKFLTQAKADCSSKPCPRCEAIFSIDPKKLKKSKGKLRHGLQVCCPHCQFVWCFLCQAPYHSGLTCKEYCKSDGEVRKWAKEWTYGQFNAQKCPKCKIFIQKAHGCDHMVCSKCKTDFCYRCGGRYIETKYFGNHLSHYSIFGCKYRFMPDRPVLRRIVRGASFAGLLGGGVVLGALGLVLGAALVGASVVIVPSYGIFRLRRHVVQKRQRKLLQAHREAVEKAYEGELGVLLSNEIFLRMTAREATLDPDPRVFDEHNYQSPSYLDEYLESHSKYELPPSANRSSEDSVETFMQIFKVATPKEASEDDIWPNFVTTADIKEIPSSDSEGYTTLVAKIVSSPITCAADPDSEGSNVTADVEESLSSNVTADSKGSSNQNVTAVSEISPSSNVTSDSEGSLSSDVTDCDGEQAVGYKYNVRL